jgi:hypothetical protein
LGDRKRTNNLLDSHMDFPFQVLEPIGRFYTANFNHAVNLRERSAYRRPGPMLLSLRRRNGDSGTVLSHD